MQLSWVLRLVQNAVQVEPGATYVIDLIPNLRWLIRSEHFSTNCAQEIAAFEEKVSHWELSYDYSIQRDSSGEAFCVYE